MLITLEKLISRTQHVINHSGLLADQAFAGPQTDPNLYFRESLNEAYCDEVEEAKQIGDARWFTKNTQFTWPSGSTTMTLPEHLRGVQMERIADITYGYPGQQMWIGDLPQVAQFHWRDRDTLQWGQTGPASDRTIEVSYRAEPEYMQDETDEPVLIANPFRHLLVYSACIVLSLARDQEAPMQYYNRRDEIRMRWHKYLSMGRPTTTGFIAVRNNDPDFYGPYP